MRRWRYQVASLIGLSLIGALPATEKACCQEPRAAALGSPYRVSSDASPAELVEALAQLRRRPASIRRRESFRLAIYDAAERILASNPTAEQAEAAILAQLATLQESAVDGNSEADDEIRELVETFSGTKRKALSAELKFYQLEGAALRYQPEETSENEETVEKDGGGARLLADIENYFLGRVPTERDLRLASSAVKIVNGLPSDDQAYRAYARLGKIFQRSQFRRLRSYGKQIAKQAKLESQVGQQLHLRGETVQGEKFRAEGDDKFRLVYFWATWSPFAEKDFEKLSQLKQQFGDRQLEVVTVSLDKDRDAWRNAVDCQVESFLPLLDPGHELAVQLNATAVPSIYVVDPEGKILVADGSWKEVTTALAGILNEDR